MLCLCVSVCEKGRKTKKKRKIRKRKRGRGREWEIESSGGVTSIIVLFYLLSDNGDGVESLNRIWSHRHCILATCRSSHDAEVIFCNSGVWTWHCHNVTATDDGPLLNSWKRRPTLFHQHSLYPTTAQTKVGVDSCWEERDVITWS
jgi:hypothetical protein